MSRTCIEPAISLDKIANTDLRMLRGQGLTYCTGGQKSSYLGDSVRVPSLSATV